MDQISLVYMHLKKNAQFVSIKCDKQDNYIKYEKILIEIGNLKKLIFVLLRSNTLSNFLCIYVSVVISFFFFFLTEGNVIHTFSGHRQTSKNQICSLDFAQSPGFSKIFGTVYLILKYCSADAHRDSTVKRSVFFKQSDKLSTAASKVRRASMT